MRTVKAFVDTSIVNRILDIEVVKPKDLKWEEDREYLFKIINNYIEKNIVQFIVNPSVKQEIKKTSDPRRREQLLALYNQFHFTAYNTTIFPFTLPATLLSKEQKEMLQLLTSIMPKGFKRDEKIFADAIFNSQIEVLLTTDEEHLANDRFRNLLMNKGFDKKIKVFTPKEFFEYLQKEGV
jgi:predicted nucleic acid-binding protein